MTKENGLPQDSPGPIFRSNEGIEVNPAKLKQRERYRRWYEKKKATDPDWVEKRRQYSRDYRQRDWSEPKSEAILRFEDYMRRVAASDPENFRWDKDPKDE